MREKTRRQEIQVGLVSMGAIVLIIGGIVWGKGFGFSVNNRSLRFRFPNAAGIDVGTPVTLNGVRQGSVTALSTDATGVQVDALVETDVPLRADARARIEMAELTGGKRIELRPGTASRALASEAIIEGEVAGDPATLLSEAGVIAANASKLILRLDTTIGTINSILVETSVQRRVDNTLMNLEDASNAARGLVIDNRARINQTIASLNTLVAELHGLVGRTGPAVERTLATTELAAGDARRTIVAAEGTLRQADTLVRRLDSVVYAVKNGRGTTSMLLHDTAFAEELRATISSVRKFIDDTQRRGLNLNISLGRPN